jgi:hypothetical protein
MVGQGGGALGAVSDRSPPTVLCNQDGKLGEAAFEFIMREQVLAHFGDTGWISGQIAALKGQHS